MKTIELKRYGELDKLFTSISKDNSVFSMDSMAICDIDDDSVVLIGKKDYDELLANKKDEKTGLEIDTKVMYSTNNSYSYWMLGLYKGNETAVPLCEGEHAFASSLYVSYEHIIPCSLFDYEEPDKWNGTENDYGTEGGAR